MRHFGENLLRSSPGLLSCDAVKSCGRIQTFRRSMLPPSSGWRWTSEKLISYYNITWDHKPEDGGSTDFRNIGILPQHYKRSQLRSWRQHGPLKRCYPTITLHSVTTQKTSTCFFTSVKAWNLVLSLILTSCKVEDITEREAPTLNLRYNF